jgi:non-canonical (house-cleaning) NTP pyrophosphatase
MSGASTRRFFLASTAAPKRDGVLNALRKHCGQDVELFCVGNIASGVPPQPVGEEMGMLGAKNRVDAIAGLVNVPVIGIESAIERRGDKYVDVAHIFMHNSATGVSVHGHTAATEVPLYAVHEAMSQSTEQDERGFAVTCGEIIALHHPTIDHQNWHYALTGTNRSELIEDEMMNVLAEFDSFVQ